MKLKYTTPFAKNSFSLFQVIAFLLISNDAWCQIYSNGNLSTGTLSKSNVTAPSNYTWSELQNNTGNLTESNRNTGFAAYYVTSGVTIFQVGDDFTVPTGEQWNISSFDFFVHQNSFMGNTIPVDQLRVQIWNGDPSLPTSSVVVGDMTTNVLNATNSGNTFIYRISSSIIGNPVIAPNTNRRVWRINGTVTTTLNPGTYWVEFQFHATDNGTIFVPTVTVVGSRGLAGWNAKQNFVANTTPGTVLGWAPINDLGEPTSAPDVPQDIPFAINGTITNLSTTENAFSSAVTVFPNPVKNILTIQDETESKWQSLVIFDDLGRKIKESTLHQNEIDLSYLAAGSYIIKIKSGNRVAVKKFVKE